MDNSLGTNECAVQRWQLVNDPHPIAEESSPLRGRRTISLSSVAMLWHIVAFSLLVLTSASQTTSAQSVRTLTPPARVQGARFNPAAINSAQIVVLTNGSVMKGRVLDQGPEKLTLQTPQGSRLVLSRDRIEAVCNSMEEAFWKKAANTRANDTAGQAALMSWCLKHELIPLAENQFDLLIQTNISAQELERLFRRLDQARNNLRRKSARIESLPESNPTAAVNEKPTRPLSSPAQSIAGQPKVTNTLRPLTPTPSATELPPKSVTGVWQPRPTNATPIKRTPNSWASRQRLNAEGEFVPYSQATEKQKPEAMRDGMVRPVGFTTNLPTENPAPRERTEPISSKQLEKLIRELPKGSVAFFRRRVEPIIIKNCSRCHQQEQLPRLIRGHDSTNSLNYSRRNIHSLLPYIESTPTPTESAVWLATTQPHGGASSALFAEGTPEADHLLVWLRMIRPDAEQANGESEATNGVAPTEWGQPIQPVEPPRDRKPIDPGLELSTIGEIPSLEKVSKGERGFVPKDPFDPEIFNRRQRAKRSQREE